MFWFGFVLVLLAMPVLIIIEDMLPTSEMVIAVYMHTLFGYTALAFVLAIWEIWQFLTRKPEPKVNHDKDPSLWTFYTSKGNKFHINPFRGVLVTGGAGSGKTESVAKQIMLNTASKGFSGLIYDFKFPTLGNTLESVLRQKNDPLRHYYVNFVDMTRTYRVNPLNPKYLPNSSYAREYATAIITNLMSESIQQKNFWVRSATDLLTATIWYLRQNHPQHCTLPHVLAMIASDDEKLVNTLMREAECANMVVSIANAMKRKADGQTAGVVSTLQSATAQINTPDIAYVLSGDDLSLDVNDPQNPITLTVGNYPTLVDTFAPAVSLIFTVALKWMNQQGKHPSFVLLDEAPTLYIPKLDMVPATARSNRVAVVYMAQDLSQMADQYGNTKADVITSNLATQFHGRTTNPRTAQHVSNLFGKDDVIYNTTSRGRHGSSTSESIQQRERVRAQDMTGLGAGEFKGLYVDDQGQSREVSTRFALLDTGDEGNGLPVVNPHAAEEVGRNFTRIREEVNAILNGGSTTPADDDFNTLIFSE